MCLFLFTIEPNLNKQLSINMNRFCRSVTVTRGYKDGTVGGVSV
jgi:hypothetical protein